MTMKKKPVKKAAKKAAKKAPAKKAGKALKFGSPEWRAKYAKKGGKGKKK